MIVVTGHTAHHDSSCDAVGSVGPAHFGCKEPSRPMQPRSDGSNSAADRGRRRFVGDSLQIAENDDLPSGTAATGWRSEAVACIAPLERCAGVRRDVPA